MAAHRRLRGVPRRRSRRVALGRSARGGSRARAALESAEAADGPAAESVATLACALGAAAKARGRAEEAEACFVHALYADETEARIRIAPGGVGSEGARGRRLVGRFRHPRSAYHLLALAEVGRGKKRYAQAEVFYLAALDALETEGGAHPTAPFEPATRDLLGVAERELGPLAASDAPSSRLRAASHALNALGLMYKDQGRLGSAAMALERATRFASALQASRDARRMRDAGAHVAARLHNLGAIRARLGRAGDASACFLRASQRARNALGASHPLTALCAAWFEACGGERSASGAAGRARASMLDAIMDGEFEAELSKPRETAWGTLAGAAGSWLPKAGGGSKDDPRGGSREGRFARVPEEDGDASGPSSSGPFPAAREIERAIAGLSGGDPSLVAGDGVRSPRARARRRANTRTSARRRASRSRSRAARARATAPPTPPGARTGET